MISTLFTAIVGIVLMSTASEPSPGCGRRPSIKTRLRFLPRPRRFRFAAPGALVGPDWMPEVNCVFDGTNCGCMFSVVSYPVEPVFWNTSLEIVAIGLGASRSRDRAMREPVTVTSSSASLSAATTFCGSALAAMAAATAAEIRYRVVPAEVGREERGRPDGCNDSGIDPPYKKPTETSRREKIRRMEKFCAFRATIISKLGDNASMLQIVTTGQYKEWLHGCRQKVGTGGAGRCTAACGSEPTVRRRERGA